MTLSCYTSPRALLRRPLRGLVLVPLLAAVGLTPGGCGATDGVPLPNESTEAPGDDDVLVARLAHVSDTHIIDEESPARLTFAKGFVPAAWRRTERYSTQLLDGIIRTINRYHESQGRIDFVVHTGDAVDNHQSNELQWYLDVFEGKRIDPSSAPDDRPADHRGPRRLDAYAPFRAQGLYRQGVHGPKPSIPWYTLAGNHDAFALGVFPVVLHPFGGLYTPLPLSNRIGLFLPVFLDPTSSVAYSPVTPAHPGPPLSPMFPTQIQANPERRYFTRAEFVAAHFDTRTGPPGHGFVSPDSNRTWYSVAPVPGLRVVALDSTRPAATLPGGFYSEGSISAEQMTFLRNELRAAQDRGEWAIVLTHHPSRTLQWSYGSAVTPEEFRATLNRYPCVVAHLCGHTHVHRVWDQGGYIELETASTLDYPQEGRFIEVWQGPGGVQLRYWVFSHLPRVEDLAETVDSDLGDDPLLEMRLIAFELAAKDPVVPGLAPAEEWIESIVGPLRDALAGLSGELGDLGETITDLGDTVTDLGNTLTDRVEKEAQSHRDQNEKGLPEY